MAENIKIDFDGTPADSARKINRFVTGVNDDGQSYFVDDPVGVRSAVVAGIPTFVHTDVWRTDETPVDNTKTLNDGLPVPPGIGPPQNGSVFRMLELPPDSVWEHVPGLKEMMHHSTPSLDYGIVLSGEVWAVLDAGERLLKAGDVLIQRGTAHVWSNRSDASALMAFVLLGGNLGPHQ